MSQLGLLLIVEDDDDFREVLVNYLTGCCEIEVAANGLEASQLIENKVYDAILSDIKMPKMNGLQLLEWLRNKNYKTPFVVLTGFGDKQLALQALSLGAYQFLDKPPQEEELKETIIKALELGQQFRFWKDDAFQEESIISLIKENSDRSSVVLAKSLGLEADYIEKLKETLLKRY